MNLARFKQREGSCASLVLPPDGTFDACGQGQARGIVIRGPGDAVGSSFHGPSRAANQSSPRQLPWARPCPLPPGQARIASPGSLPPSSQARVAMERKGRRQRANGPQSRCSVSNQRNDVVRHGGTCSARHPRECPVSMDHEANKHVYLPGGCTLRVPSGNGKERVILRQTPAMIPDGQARVSCRPRSEGVEAWCNHRPVPPTRRDTAREARRQRPRVSQGPFQVPSWAGVSTAAASMEPRALTGTLASAVHH